MKLIAEWKLILVKAWSVRLALLAAMLGGVELALPLFSDAMPRGWFMAASVVTSLAVTVARIVAQRGVPDA